MQNQDLDDFNKEAKDVGQSDEQIKSSLLASGRNQEDIESAMRDRKIFSPNVAAFFNKHKKPILSGIGIILIAILAVAVWQFFPHKPKTPARFTLEAILSDTAGVNPGTSFILKSTQSLNESAVKKIVKFNPEIDFEVKKTSLASGFIAAVFAQNNESNITQSAFEIKPTQPLTDSEIYQVQIDDQDYADHEYSWAFQVKAQFQIVQTHPSDKGTSVPINSGIEIVFNRENLIYPQDYFEITPKINGTFEQYGNTLVFLPKNLSERTIYNVIIKKGLKSQGSDDVLGEDYSFSFETGETGYSGSRPYFNLQSDFLEFIPGKNPTFEVSYYNLDPASLEFNVYKFSDANDFLNSYQESRKWEWGWTRFYRDGYVGYNPEGKQKIISFKPTVIAVGYQKFIEIPQALEQGYYLLDTMIGSRHEQAWLQITSLSRYFSISHDKSLLWVYDFSKKEPVDDLKGFYLDKTGSKDIGSTNKDGLIEFATPDSLKQENNPGSDPKFLRVEKKNYLPFLIKITDSWGWSQNVSKGDLYWNYLSTDRYVYQMSDTLRYWGVAKGRQDDLRNKKVKVGLYDQFFYGYGGWGGSSFKMTEQKPLASQELLISQFDTISGEISFKGITPGYYNLAVTLGDEILSTAEIQVMTYSKPVYQITVTPSRQTMYAGENVDFKVSAKFFDGTPVNNLKLHYRGYWQNSFEGDLTLNQSGEGNVSYNPVYFETSNAYYPRNLWLSFYPVSSEEGEIVGESNISVFGQNLYLQASQEKLSGDRYKFTSKLNKILIDNDISDESGLKRFEYIGDAVANYSLEAKIVKIIYRQIETGQYYDPIDKVVRKIYGYRSDEQEIELFSGSTNNSGEWSFEKKLPQEENSYYEIRFSGRDSRGRALKSSAWAGFASYEQWKQFAVSLDIGGESYAKEFSFGEKVNLSMRVINGQTSANAKVLFYRYQNSIDKISVSSNFNYEENFEEKFSPSVQYQAVILGPYGFEETNSVTASFKEADKKLDIDINPDKNSYRPGDDVKVSLAVKDKNDGPVKSELNVAVVDEALFHILPYNWRPKILDVLYTNIYASLITGASQYANPKSPGAEGGGCFAAGTPILMADGSSKAIEKIRIGDEILTLENENSKTLKPAVVQGISSHLVDGYLVINDSLKVTPEHKIYLNGNWAYAGQAKIGDVLLDSKGTSQEIYSIKEQKVKSILVYNIVVGKYHTYFADNFFVHNAEKGGSTRVDFADVPFYQTIQTDSSGRAQISFRAPDNITSWRTTAIAFSSATMQAGDNEKVISVSLPFFVDATLSNYYLVGDNPFLRLRAVGTGYNSNENVEFTIQAKTLNLDHKEISKDTNVFIQLGELPEGEHEIKITAKQGQLQDSLIKKIKVVKGYFKTAESSQYNLSANLSSIEGDKDGYTDLMFVDEGKGKFYGSLWSNSFLSGIRADQITANYFATRMLNQYFNEPQPGNQLDLSGYQTQNGGIGLFPYSDDDLELSAKISDLAPDFVSQNNLKNYFETALRDKKADMHRIAKALYGLASLRQPVLAKINLVKASKDLDLEDKIYLSLALVKLGDKENGRQIYSEAIRLQVRFQGPDGWLAQESDNTKQVKLSSMIAVLASYLNVEGDKDALWNYSSQHSPQRDLNMLERIMIAKTELARAKNQIAEFSYQIGSKTESVKIENGRPYLITLSADELKIIKFNNIEGKISLISFYEKTLEPDGLSKNNELTVSRKYLVNNAAVSSFREDSVVLVRLDPNIASSAIDGSYQVVDYLPSGLRAITQIYEKGLSGGTKCDPIWYPNKIVDNAIYFTIYKGFDKDNNCANRTINYYARVVSKGDFQANPTLIQSLKDLNSLNISDKQNIEIK